jgi:hypothetical protein
MTNHKSARRTAVKMIWESGDLLAVRRYLLQETQQLRNPTDFYLGGKSADESAVLEILTDALVEHVVTSAKSSKKLPDNIETWLQTQLKRAYPGSNDRSRSIRSSKILSDANKRLFALPDSDVKGLRKP